MSQRQQPAAPGRALLPGMQESQTLTAPAARHVTQHVLSTTPPDSPANQAVPVGVSGGGESARPSAGTRSGVSVRPRYFHRVDGEGADLLAAESRQSQLSQAQQQSLLELKARPSMVVSGVMLVENEDHRNVEGDPDLVKKLVGQRKLIVKCVAGLTVVILALILAWLIVPSVRQPEHKSHA